MLALGLEKQLAAAAGLDNEVPADQKAVSVMMVGTAVYSCGMIGFVGLVIPHGVRMVFGTNHKYVIPVSALSGGIFLIWADVACRVILAYSEIPIGMLVSMIGAPCFIYLMVCKAYGGVSK